MTPAELRDWRLAHGLTQAQAATWVGVSRRLWIRWEMGDRPVPKWLRIIVAVLPGSGRFKVLEDIMRVI